MSNPTWPSGLPDFLIGGYKRTLADNVARTQTAVGPDRTRRRTAANTAPVEAGLLLTTAEVATFETFFYGSLEGGALAFDKVDGRSGDTVTLRFKGAPQADEETAWPLVKYALKMELMP